MSAYSSKAQPFLDAFAQCMFGDIDFRDWVLEGTSLEKSYAQSTILIEEQRAVRWRISPTKQPFWANYWCGRDARCTCRIEGSKGLESDAIFFIKSTNERRAAVHIEFKHPGEKFGFGQPEAYPLRAACFAQTHSRRPTLNAHDDWTTVLICSEEDRSDPRVSCFERSLTHTELSHRIPLWP